MSLNLRGPTSSWLRMLYLLKRDIINKKSEVGLIRRWTTATAGIQRQSNLGFFILI